MWEVGAHRCPEIFIFDSANMSEILYSTRSQVSVENKFWGHNSPQSQLHHSISGLFLSKYTRFRDFSYYFKWAIHSFSFVVGK
jgi:hypothetical protein